MGEKGIRERERVTRVGEEGIGEKRGKWKSGYNGRES